jgi:hypothetical protein
MKSILCTMFFLLWICPAQAEPQAGQFWCVDFVTDELVEVLPGQPFTNCVAHLVWGKENTCFSGDAENLVGRINQAEFSWLSAGLLMREASYDSKKDVIVFLGVIQQSFYQSMFDIKRCGQSLK